MSYIHERPGWPKFTWQEDKLSPILAHVRYQQGRLLGQLESLGFALSQEANLTVLTTDVVRSSAIEGVHLDVTEVRSCIARRLGLESAGLARSSRDVEGIVEMMLDATQNYSADLTADRLFAWHAALFPTGRSGMTPITVGAWRPPEAGPMQVISGAFGREKVHFEAPAADRLSAEMETFLNWYNAPLSTDPVLKAGLAHFWFITIHPFEDGNGRIARCIADMSLARADASKSRFYSMSSQIAAERKEYYATLEFAQSSELDITPWLLWFLECLTRAIDNAHKDLAAVLRTAKIWQRINLSPVNQRQRVVINKLLDNFKGVLTSSKYAKLAECSADTALRDIQEMIERGILLKNCARGRSTSYRLAELGDGDGR